MRGIHRSPVNSLHKAHWRGAFMLTLICAWTANNRDAGELRRHHVHCDVTAMALGTDLAVICYPWRAANSPPPPTHTHTHTYTQLHCNDELFSIVNIISSRQISDFIQNVMPQKVISYISLILFYEQSNSRPWFLTWYVMFQIGMRVLQG